MGLGQAKVPDKAATFGGSPLSGSSASGEELSQSMPALKTTRSYDGDSPESNHVSAKDSSSSPAPSKSGTAKSASGRAMSNVELLRMQEDIKLDKQLRALELHEREGSWSSLCNSRVDRISLVARQVCIVEMYKYACGRLNH